MFLIRRRAQHIVGREARLLVSQLAWLNLWVRVGARPRQLNRSASLFSMVMKLEFMFGDLPVGFFQGTEYPRRKGQYRYTAYRGPGHFNMQTERDAAGQARCYYDLGAERITFTVVDCPTSGVLELADIDSCPLVADAEQIVGREPR